MDKTVFKTKKPDLIFIILFILIITVLGISLILLFLETEDVLFTAIFSLCSIIFLAIISSWKLRIVIENNHLIVHKFFTWYKADINKITKIRKGETMWSGFHKYGTATKGLIIFAKYKDDLYITPENEQLFIEKIREINPEIVFEKV